MLKPKLLTFLLVIFIAVGPGILQAQDFEIFFNGGIVGGNKIADSIYRWDWGADYIDVLEIGSISSQISQAYLGFSAGINYFYSPNFGVSLSVTHAKRNIDFSSDYTISWTWFDSESHSRDRNWNDTGSISITPIMVDLVYQVLLNPHFNINIRLGIGLFLTQFKLNSHLGYGESLETADYYYIDWYDLKVKAEQSHNFVGGDVGIDFEQKISHKFGIYAGVQYFYASPRRILLEVEPLDVYYGEEGQLYTTATPDIHLTSPISIKLHFSFFKTFLGLKVYF